MHCISTSTHTHTKSGGRWSSPGCRGHTHAGQCFLMHSGHSCQLHRTAGVPGVVRGHNGTPETADVIVQLRGTNHKQAGCYKLVLLASPATPSRGLRQDRMVFRRCSGNLTSGCLCFFHTAETAIFCSQCDLYVNEVTSFVSHQRNPQKYV